MEEVQVEIMVQTITAQYGTLSPGDRLRTNSAFAAHLVNDCHAAKYHQTPALPPVAAANETADTEPSVMTSTHVQTSAQLADGPDAQAAASVEQLEVPVPKSSRKRSQASATGEEG